MNFWNVYNFEKFHEIYETFKHEIFIAHKQHVLHIPGSRSWPESLPKSSH